MSFLQTKVAALKPGWTLKNAENPGVNQTQQLCQPDFCDHQFHQDLSQSQERQIQRAKDLRRWEDWLEGLSGPEPPFSI